MTSSPLTIQRASAAKLPRLDEIRQAAFAPVFASFRKILGDTIYDVAQAPEEARQSQLLASLFQPDSGWQVYTATLGAIVVGFVSVKLDTAASVGEIGLNAVHPDHAGQGVGTAMYTFVIERMKEAGIRVATVATGGDPSHAAARKAYRNAGFCVEIPSVWMCRALDLPPD